MTHAALIQPVVINQSDVKVDDVFIENDFIYIIFVVSRLKVFPCSIHFRRPQNEPFNDHDRQARHMETSTCTCIYIILSSRRQFYCIFTFHMDIHFSKSELELR